jgi:broad specificity phosphatase PhoE
VTTIILARHAETDWNREHRWQGHADPPLNRTGLDQAWELSQVLEGEQFDAIYSSDLRRALETADAVARERELVVIVETGLREIDIGEWSGLTTTEIQQRHPDGFARHSMGGDGWEHGETHAAMSERVVEAVTRIAAAHPDGQVLCVMHGGTIRAVLAHAEGMDLGEWRRTRLGPVNGEVRTITVENGTFQLREP